MKMISSVSPEVLSISIVECGEPLIDIKNYNDLQYGPPPECEQTKNDYTKIRKTVFEKLCLAQNDLPYGWKFRLYEGFRSLDVQQMLFDQEYNRIQIQKPSASHQEIFLEATQLISPVINLDGSKNIPPHNTGGAIDIEVTDKNNQLVDMGMAIKDWFLVKPEICLTECDIISKDAQHNRKILLNIMQSHGFINFPNEWWHFSYGDRFWAYHKKQANAIYGSIKD